MDENSLEALIIENFSKAVAFFDSEGNPIFSNKEWDNFCGSNTTISLLNYKEFLELMSIQPMADNETFDSIKTTCCSKRAVLVRRKKLSSSDLSGILVEIEDISGIEEANSQIKTVLSDSMWKVRTSISNIQNVINLLIDYPYCELNEEYKNLMILTNLETWKLSRYIDKLRLFCLFTTDRKFLKIKCENINVKKLIEEAIQYFDILIKTLPKKPQIKIFVDENISFYSDYYICFMAVTAVLYNALLYNNGDVLINITATKKEKDTTISISDNGIGIKDNALKHIFSYGFSQNNRENKNSGTELHLVRRLLNFIGAEIYFISKEDKGSKFDIIIKDIE